MLSKNELKKKLAKLIKKSKKVIIPSAMCYSMVLDKVKGECSVCQKPIIYYNLYMKEKVDSIKELGYDCDLHLLCSKCAKLENEESFIYQLKFKFPNETEYKIKQDVNMNFLECLYAVLAGTFDIKKTTISNIEDVLKAVNTFISEEN